MFIRTPLRALEGSEGGGIAPPPATADAATPASTPTEAAPSHGDWAGMAKSIRETSKQQQDIAASLASIAKALIPAGTKPTVASAPAAPAGGSTSDVELAEIKARLALDEVLDDLGVPLTRDRRNMMRRLHAAERPTDVADWAGRTVDSLGWKAAAAAAVAAPAAPPRPFDPGAPAGAAAPGIPLDPAQIPESVAKAMTPAQATEWWQRYKAQGGAFRHPFDAANKAAREAGSTADVARQVAVALSGLPKS